MFYPHRQTGHLFGQYRMGDHFPLELAATDPCQSILLVEDRSVLVNPVLFLVSQSRAAMLPSLVKLEGHCSHGSQRCV